VFFINLLILEPEFKKNRLFLGEAFKMMGEALKNTLVKWGVPAEGASSFIGLAAGSICADQ